MVNSNRLFRHQATSDDDEPLKCTQKVYLVWCSLTNATNSNMNCSFLSEEKNVIFKNNLTVQMFSCFKHDPAISYSWIQETALLDFCPLTFTI